MKERAWEPQQARSFIQQVAASLSRARHRGRDGDGLHGRSGARGNNVCFPGHVYVLPPCRGHWEMYETR